VEARPAPRTQVGGSNCSFVAPRLGRGQHVPHDLRPLVLDDRHPSDGPDIDVRIRVDEGGVRFAISVNLAFVDENTGFVRELEDHLDPAEFGGLYDALIEWYRGALDVRIDGQPAVLETVDARTPDGASQAPDAWGRLQGELVYVEGPRAMVRHFPDYGIRALSLVKVEFSYPSATEPHTVAIRWLDFPADHAQPVDPPPPMKIRAQINDGRGDLPLEFTSEEPEYVWHGEVTTALERFLPVVEPPAPIVHTLPAVSLGCGVVALALLGACVAPRVRARAGLVRTCALLAVVVGLVGVLTRDVARIAYQEEQVAAIDAAQAASIFEALHENLYTAFDQDDRDAIYTALEQCVAGEQLDAIYQRVFKSLVMADQGGAVSRVQAVRHVATELESAGALAEFGTRGFTVAARWQVDGRVTHFGHSHERTQEYAGRFTIGEVGGEWRILGDELREEFVVTTRADDRR
jgi:hypothetical protein